MDDGSFSEIFEDDDFLGILEDFAHCPSISHQSLTLSSKEIHDVVETSSSRTKRQPEYSETDLETSPRTKRQKLGVPSEEPKVSHITVERNRRKQMNEHLSVLRSLMPCFYVKRGDQASIIGGVVDYINELQQLLQSLEAKKQRKVYTEVLSPRLAVSSPRLMSPLSPRKPPLSPRLNLPMPISPRTPQPVSPYPCRPPRLPSSLEPSPTSSASSSINDNINELVANSRSEMADVEVKFSGPHVVLKTLSCHIPGQALKIISALEDLALEILHVSITTVDDSMINSFTIKIGTECQLSAEELAHQVQQTFCQLY